MGNLSNTPPAAASPEVAMTFNGASAAGVVDACQWCKVRRRLRPLQLYCSQVCRQAAWRLRQGLAELERTSRPLTFAYADPPYPGFARRLYGMPEVNHVELIGRLERRREAGELAGWALSTSASTLRQVLPICPPDARICAWVKPIGVSGRSLGLHNAWEPLIVLPGRRRRPGRRDWLAAQPARRGGDLIGRKPLAFCRFLFEALGMAPGDKLFDLYPGTGIVGRAWENLSTAAAGDA